MVFGTMLASSMFPNARQGKNMTSQSKQYAEKMDRKIYYNNSIKYIT